MTVSAAYVLNLDPVGMSSRIDAATDSFEELVRDLVEAAADAVGDEVDLDTIMDAVRELLASETDDIDEMLESLAADAYLMGAVHAYDDYAEGDADNEDEWEDRGEFMSDFVGNAAFGWHAPVANARKPALPPRDSWGQFVTTKTKEMSERLAAGWKQEAGVVSDAIAGIVTKGLAAGKPPEAIRDDILSLSKDIPRHRANMIAITESTRFHSEGQLDAYEKLGIKTVSGVGEVEVEVVTAGDRRVCPECIAMSKVLIPIERARGIIPLHPMCRCRWKAVRERRVRNQYRCNPVRRARIGDNA